MIFFFKKEKKVLTDMSTYIIIKVRKGWGDDMERQIKNKIIEAQQTVYDLLESAFETALKLEDREEAKRILSLRNESYELLSKIQDRLEV